MVKPKPFHFVDWMFKKRDIDGLVIAFLVSGAVAAFINDLTKAVMEPIVRSLMANLVAEDYNNIYQTLNIYNIIVIRFQLQFIITGILRMSLTLGIAYVFVMYVYKLLSLQVGDSA
jgi:hypothetical protein